MTEQEIAIRLNEIRAMKGDDEAQHSAEDALHRHVLTAISESISIIDAGKLAKKALESDMIEFARWCA